MTASIKELSRTEDLIVRELAALGHSPNEMSAEMAARGIKRGAATIRMHLWRHNIRIDGEAYKARRGAPLREGRAYVIEQREHVYVSPFEANDLFAAAFAAGSDGRLYQDDPRAAWKSRVFQPTWTRDYGANHMTTGGVAVYG
jgi:hypothetical protein